MNIKSALETCPVFQETTPDFIARLAEQAQIIRAEKGQILFVNGDPSPRFFLIAEGWIKLFRETVDGAQAVLDILPRGSLLAETLAFQDGRHTASAEAIEPSLLISLPAALLKKETEENPKLAVALLQALARKEQDKARELEHRTLKTAPQRIACFLLRLIDQTKSGKVTIDLPYDKTLLASRLGMQPETFSRALAKLKKLTGLRIKGGTVEAESPAPLVTHACSSCSSQYPCRDLCPHKPLNS